MINKYKKQAIKGLLTILAITWMASTITLADDYMYVKATHLNVRAEGTVKSKIIATVDSWYKVTILESLTNWWKKVLLENWQIWYVNGWYLVASEPAYEKVTSARYTIKSGTAFMRGFDLIQKVAVLNQGDILEVTSEKVYLNRWIQVRVVDAKHPRYNWRTWYVAKRLLSELSWYEYIAPIVEVPVVEMPVIETPVEDTPVITEDVPADILPDFNSAPEEVVVPQVEESDTGSWVEDASIEDEFAKLFEWL